MKKELVILSGFLGSGKTTFLLEYVKQRRERKIALLLNDFGEIPIDGKLLAEDGFQNEAIVEIGGGSVFCSCLRASFLSALKNMAARDEDLVIVEGSGMSDPALIDKMLALSGLDAVFEHSSTICLFDPVKSLKLARGLEVIPRQLASATLAVVTKCDMTDEDRIAAAEDYIRSREPDLPVARATRGVIARTPPRQRARQQGTFGFNTPENRPDSFMVDAVRCDVDRFLDALEKDENILRIKGFLTAGDGVWFVSDTGTGVVKKRAPQALAPVSVICIQGTGNLARQSLVEKGIIDNPAL